LLTNGSGSFLTILAVDLVLADLAGLAGLVDFAMIGFWINFASIWIAV
jgi:hypothetical protein